jgi:hypothetical protein
MTDYAYACEKCGESKRGIVVKDNRRICTKCAFEENYPGRVYPY